MTLIPFVHEFKKSTPLIEINYGTSLTAYITTSRSPVVWDGKVWLPEPAISVDLPKQSGTLAEESCTIDLPRENNLHPGVATIAELLSSPRSCPPIRVRIINLIESGPEDVTPVYLYEGVDDRTVRNPDGQEGIVKLTIIPDYRYQIGDISLGMRADPTCGHVYGGLGCWHPDVDKFMVPGDYGLPAKVHKINVTLSVNPIYSGRQVQVFVDPSLHPGATYLQITQRPKNWWKRAFLERDGLRISIADWRWNNTLNTGTDIFILNRIPPADWHLGKAVLHPGCTRTAAACAERLNTGTFGGYGNGIPAYNPVLEIGDS